MGLKKQQIIKNRILLCSFCKLERGFYDNPPHEDSAVKSCTVCSLPTPSMLIYQKPGDPLIKLTNKLIKKIIKEHKIKGHQPGDWLCCGECWYRFIAEIYKAGYTKEKI